MPIGPGKYDAQCTRVREETHAKGVLLAVLEGDKGLGFSVQAPFEITLLLPAILRDIANQIEKSLEEGHA
jgi:hypothetical protein